MGAEVFGGDGHETSGHRRRFLPQRRQDRRPGEKQRRVRENHRRSEIGKDETI